MSDRNMFSVSVYMYRNGMKIVSIANNGYMTDKVMPYNQILYRQIKKLVVSYAEKSEYFDAHFYPMLKLEDFD